MNINLKTRQLIRFASKGYLSTRFDPENFEKKSFNIKKSFPYSTFTLTAFDYDLSPILLFSNLSEHTTNIKNYSTVSLMLCEEEKLYDFFPKFLNKKPVTDYEDPMSRPRVTIIGDLFKTNDKNLKSRFLSRHPASKLYANFADMNFYRMKIKSAHLIGGFAHVKWFSKKDLCVQNIKNFPDSEINIIDHMNQCHQESVNLYASKLRPKSSNRQKVQNNWRIVGIDPDGFDLRKKNILTRICFEKEISDAKKLRGIFVNLHKKASNL